MKIHFIYTEDIIEQRYYIRFLKNLLYYFDPGVVYTDATKAPGTNPGPADLVLLFNYKAYKFYHRHLHRESCVIYISCLSAIVDMVRVDMGRIDGFIHMPDRAKNQKSFLAPDEFTCKVTPAFIEPGQQPGTANNMQHILVVNDCSNDQTNLFQALIKIANGCFNKFRHTCPVTFLTRISIPDGLLAENINKITASKKDVFETRFVEACKNHRIAIASGIYAQLACANMKNVIVVGHRGYGGNVTVSNLENYLHHHFAGRPGGQIDEYIPDGFVLKEIDELKRKPAKASRDAQIDLYEKLTVMHDHAREKIWSFITKLLHEKELLTGNFTEAQFRLSENYYLADLNQKCFLINMRTNLEELELSRQEFLVIKKFTQAVKVSDMISLCVTAEDKADMKEFISDLFANKVLVHKNGINES